MSALGREAPSKTTAVRWPRRTSLRGGCAIRWKLDQGAKVLTRSVKLQSMIVEFTIDYTRGKFETTVRGDFLGWVCFREGE
jgi:hypothetical protein